jgi:hypothetical protein
MSLDFTNKTKLTKFYYSQYQGIYKGIMVWQDGSTLTDDKKSLKILAVTVVLNSGSLNRLHLKIKKYDFT